MLILPVLIDDLFKITNQFIKNDLDVNFFEAKIIQFGFKVKKSNYDFCLKFHDSSLVSLVDHLDGLGRMILEASKSWSNPKLDHSYQILSFNNQKKTLTFNFDKCDFLVRIFRSEYRLNCLLERQSVELLGNSFCVITIQDEDEWTNLRISSFRDCLVNILKSSTNRSPMICTESTLSNCNLEEFSKIYLVQSESSKFKLSFNTNLNVIKIGKIVVDLEYKQYKLKLKNQFDQFDEETIDDLIKLKMLSFKPNHRFKLDFEYKQFIFLHYNHARLLVLIEKCSKIFNSQFELDDNFQASLETACNQDEIQSNHLSRDLNDYTFNNNFISLSSFLSEFELDQMGRLPQKATNQLILLCNDFSRYYQKKKVLDYSSFPDLICLKMNLLKSVFSLMNVYFNILNVKPLDSI